MGMMLRKHLAVDNIASAFKEPESKEVKTEEKSEPQAEYTKTEINRMNVADLKKMAKKLGISVTDESTGSGLKKEIITKLGL